MRKRRPTTAVAGSTRRSIEVLLAEDVDQVGSQGDIIRVKPGYARNYLLPNGLATIATEENKRMVSAHRRRIEQARSEQIATLRGLADRISQYNVTLEANANKDGQLYGSIVAADISRALISAGYNVEEDHIKLDGPLKQAGLYTVKIQLHPEVGTEMKVWVVPTTGR